MYFNQDFLDFFDELSKNNNREWFHANKKTYEKAVKAPFKAFVGDLIADIQGSFNQDMHIEAKDAIFRINRDIRFSKDKSPYKTHVGAILSSGGKKNKGIPGHYIHLEMGRVMVGGGAYFVEKEPLAALRNYLTSHGDELNELLDEKSFKKHFGEIVGDKNKRLPKALQEAADRFPLIYNKQFYYMTEMPPESILKPGFFKKVMKLFQLSHPVNQFLECGMYPTT